MLLKFKFNVNLALQQEKHRLEHYKILQRD